MSGRAIQACRDVQQSETRKDSFSDLVNISNTIMTDYISLNMLRAENIISIIIFLVSTKLMREELNNRGLAIVD